MFSYVDVMLSYVDVMFTDVYEEDVIVGCHYGSVHVVSR